MYRFYVSPTTLDEALRLKAEHGHRSRLIAGGTDLLIELDRGLRSPEPSEGHGDELGLIDLTRIPGLAEIREADGRIRLGPLVTHNQCVASPVIGARAFPLARACWEVGAPQIRNRATVAGNLITASPANDSITPLLALDATVTLTSAARGSRTLPLQAFYTGFRQVDLAPDEILTEIAFAPLDDHQEGTFVKLGLRRAQAVSVLNTAVVVTWDEAHRVARAAIALGAVAPVVVRAPAAEQALAGRPLDEAAIAEASHLAQEAASPIDDIRATADYRRAMVAALVARALHQIRDGQARAGWPENPVMLWGAPEGAQPGVWPVDDTAQAAGLATVNGARVELVGGMTLLDSLRLAGYVGVKEGCAEGECGACTVFLDGMAVMACLVPAERAAGSEVVTVEGLGTPQHLHPVQAALVRSGGVQCGYCTPGFVMSGAKLLEERPQPTRGEIQEAFTGNFCRCTGYRKILDAVAMAGQPPPAAS